MGIGVEEFFLVLLVIIIKDHVFASDFEGRGEASVSYLRDSDKSNLINFQHNQRHCIHNFV